MTNKKHATTTSNGNTKTEEAETGRNGGKKPVDTRIPMFSNGNTIRCSSSRRVVSWRPWVIVVPLVMWLVKRGFRVNRVLNEAFLDWVGGLGDEELRLRARLYRLLDEERELRQVHRVILRSGAFLDSYAEKLLKGGNVEDAKLGRKPLEVLNKEEVPVIRQLLARREAVVKEICEIEKRLLPGEEYVLKSERRGRRRRGRSRGTREHKSVNNVRTGKRGD